MREFFLSAIIKITSGLHSWAHKQKYNKDQKFCACASKKQKLSIKFDEKSTRLQ